MAKISIQPRTYLYPMPAVLVGALVNGKATYVTIAYCGIVQRLPPMISVASNKAHYTNIGIRENRTFSVNIASEEMAQVTDYVGIYSGKTTDKSTLFENFFGTLKTAPMIQECPLNLECRLVQTVDVSGGNDIFIGEIVGVYAEEKYLTNGAPDVNKIRPLIFSMPDNHYWKFGDCLAPAWSIGKSFQPGQK
ncbi:MAG: putative NADPH-flavin oxidoreductase [Chloroflexi bacterium]|nr:putative NADPH-flavin oxidoreductase [Chloroflexota bacterium]